MMKGEIYEKPFSASLSYLFKRFVLLAAKLLGFKGFCLFLATVLLCCGKLEQDVWLTLAVTLVCSASGIRVLDSFKEGYGTLDVKTIISGVKNVLYRKEYRKEKSGDNAACPSGFEKTGISNTCFELPDLSGHGRDAGSGGTSDASVAFGPDGGDAALPGDGPSGVDFSSGASSSRRKASKVRRRISSSARKRAKERAVRRIREVLKKASEGKK